MTVGAIRPERQTLSITTNGSSTLHTSARTGGEDKTPVLGNSLALYFSLSFGSSGGPLIAVGHSLSIQKFGQTENQTRVRSDEERHAKGETGGILVEALFHRLSIRLPLSFSFKRHFCRSAFFLFFFFCIFYLLDANWCLLSFSCP